MFGVLAIIPIIEAQERRKREAAEFQRLLSMPVDQRDLELRLRELRARERQAAQSPVINVKNSLF